MSRLTKIIVGVLVLAVILVFIAPTVNLEPTALRSAQAALSFFAAIGFLIVLPYTVASAVLQRSLFEDLFTTQGCGDVLDLLCSRLC